MDAIKRSVVALVPLDSYEDQEKVNAAVREGISLLGGIRKFVSPEEKILLKPNLLSRSLPQKAVTTHPAVFEATACLLRSEGFEHLTYGDSPGNPTVSAEKTAAGSGLQEPAERYGVTFGDFSNCRAVSFPEGAYAHSFMLCKGVTDADAVISLCKMKTHALERITGAVKNLYGCILGLNKGAGHALYPTAESFARMLTDLHRCVKPRLHIMDGVTAMEGNGPTSGTPVDMKVLLFSADPVALDSVYCRLIDLDPRLVWTCVCGQEAGIGTFEEDRITLLTPDGEISFEEAAGRYGKPDFDVARGRMKKVTSISLMKLLPFLQARPKVDKNRCVACGICQEACPVPEKAVHSGKGQKAVYDYKKCIRCYCCQEMCPARAISVWRNPVERLLDRGNGKNKEVRGKDE